MTTKAKTATVPENGETVFIPLNKLKKHPKNARKTPHSEASIEAKAASIAVKGILQNLVVEPERDSEGDPPPARPPLAPCYPGLADGQGCSAALRSNPSPIGERP